MNSIAISHEISHVSFELIAQLYESEQDFPVSFDLAWQWLGYATKASAKRKLAKHFQKGFDYKVFNQDVENLAGGRFEESIWLSANCLKEMGMMAGTEKGKQIRQYFLQCEAIAKQSVKLISQLQAQASQSQDRIVELERKLDGVVEAIATLQSQVLPDTSNAPPPGWDVETWASLPSQDKRHFRYLWRRRKFRPSNQSASEPLMLPASIEGMKERQCNEAAKIVGEPSEEEKQRLDTVRKDMLAKFWADGGES